MTDLQRAIYEIVASLQPNAYGVTIHRSLLEQGHDVSIGRMYDALSQLERGGGGNVIRSR